MPRIRKKTSNRASTNDRKKLEHKVKESRKKKAKAAKKNPQWKSKHKKDPGIPGEFPYKDQILAEVAEQRRIAEEEKQRRKNEKKTARMKHQPEADAESGSEAEAEEVEVEAEAQSQGNLPAGKKLNVGADGIASLSAKLITATLKKRPIAVEEVEEEEEEEEVPVLINRDLPTLRSVLDKADVVVEILDARDPLSYRSKHLEDLALAGKKKTVLVLNKIDTCPRECVASWSTHLRTQHPTFLFRSATSFLPTGPEPTIPPKGKGKGKAKIPVDDAVGVDSVLAYLSKCTKAKDKEPLTVAIVGFTNSGKSAFINSILRKAALPVYSLASSSRGPTTTALPQEVALEAGKKDILFIDTPGLSWATDDEAENLDEIRARDILLRSKGRIDRLKDPAPPVAQLVSRANTEDLMLLYSLPAFAKGDSTSFLSGVARSNQLIKKKGELDLTGAARIVLKDWNTGKFARFTTAPPSASTATSLDADLYIGDEAILAALPTRKQMRKSNGLVKLTSGALEERKAAIEEQWAALQDEEDSDEDNEEDESDMEADVADEEKEEDVEMDEDEEDEAMPVPAAISNKQKRKRGAEPIPAPPSKKVAFAADPKSSKQARKAGSLKGRVVAQEKETGGENPTSRSAAARALQSKAVPAKTKTAAKDVKDAKVANMAAKKSKVTAAAGGNEEAYDFGRFF
ncbi:hypothetical protein BDQ12DRAFT_635436 [Crucibulum laeve]|uniref:P-loop containing nucleoside triphosphate hydrolase protein n=1 Tax=Crucibulum laeve TaxID=68775 RepID=A0A5C3LPD8_9AGAR|nr:hypothetical protein BDQ12DRAFT_635436 [Crucibulum laeve]